MKKLAKKYEAKLKTYDPKKVYDTKEAISVVKKNATAKFDETIELHIRTGCDSKYAEQQIRGSVVLPAGTGKKVKILVFAKDAKAEGYENIAALFEKVGQIEKSHKERYERLLEQVKNGTVFSREKPVIWICSNCGYSQTSAEAPDECPVCSHSKAYFYCE